MPRDRFYIGPLNTGLQKNVKPFAIADDAFQALNNAYPFRGRLKKKFGTGYMTDFNQLSSRLRIFLGVTNGAGNLSGTVPGDQFNIGQIFSVDSEIFTVFQTGTPAAMKISGSATLATYNTTTGAYVINGAAPNTNAYFYPALPVMGLPNYENQTVNFEPLLAFDTRFAYEYKRVNTGWSRLGTAVWSGTNSDFFWSTNYRGSTSNVTYLYTTNFVDPIRYWDGTTWTDFTPDINNAGDYIETARLILPFKNRLILFNTIENIGAVSTSFVNRIRVSQNGSPTQSDAYNENIPGKGFFLDAPTKEQIISAIPIKDRIIVYFERSTWELVYTTSEILPFRWQRIDSELGAESPFSAVPFDKAVLAVGNVGIHACSGAAVERIDNKIPDEVFTISSSPEALQRVYGVRDYFSEMVYWTFPEDLNNYTYPRKVLAFNYAFGSWAFFDDSFTCFGYYQDNEQIFSREARFRYVVAGNQEGWVQVLLADRAFNVGALQITNITGPTATLTIIDHNLIDGSFIFIENCLGITSLNNTVFKVDVVNSNTIRLLDSSGDTVTVAGTYLGGGTVANIARIDILSKQYNFYVNTGQTAQVMKIDYFVDSTLAGEITVDTMVSSSSVSLLTDGLANGSILGTGVLEMFPYLTVPFEATQERLWHPMYVRAEGDVVQLRMYLSDTQMFNNSISQSPFELHAMIIHATPGSTRLG